MPHFWKIITLVMLAGLLGGCATVRHIDADVLTVVTTPAGLNLQGAKYRFERLPSQANNPEAGLAEQQAQAAMAAVGLVRDDALAQISVQVGFSGLSYQVDPWGRPWYGPWAPYGSIYIGRGIHPQVGMGMNMRVPPSPQFRREVSLLMRDLRSGQIVYETRASHDGPWSDAANIFATLFQAAMAEFPNPPAGMRRVNIDIPR